MNVAQMGSALLDRHNYTSLEYKMHQYLVRQWYWSYIEGAQETAHDLISPNYPTWQQGANRVMYCLATRVQISLSSISLD